MRARWCQLCRSAWSSMTNCAVTGAPKLSEKGAARSNSSSVNARTASAACATVPAQEFERGGLRYLRLSWACLAFNSATTSHVTSVMALPLAMARASINLNRIHAGDMVHDDADRTAVRTPTPVYATPLPRVLQQRQPGRQHLPRCDQPVIQRDDSWSLLFCE